MTSEQICEVEKIVNQAIYNDLELDIFYTTLKEAQSAGVTAFFGEKYSPGKVRVVKIDELSAELCGGTHVKRTGEIGCFKILSESALATGTRRIMAVTGPAALSTFQENFRTVKLLSEDFKIKPHELLDVVKKQREDFLKATKAIKQMRKKSLKFYVDQWQSQVKTVGTTPFLFLELEDYDSDDLRLICLEIEKKNPGFYFLISRIDDQMRFLGYGSKKIEIDLKKLTPVLKEIGLRGGGAANLIQGGGVGVDSKVIKNCVEKWVSELK
jgi:alanyl-tRNA synthetase